MFLTAIDEAKLNNVEKCEGICADLLSFDEIDVRSFDWCKY